MRYISFHVHSLRTAVGCDSINERLSLFSSLVSNDAHQKGQVINICIGRMLCKLRPPFGKGGGEWNEPEGFNPPVRYRSLSPLPKGDWFYLPGWIIVGSFLWNFSFHLALRIALYLRENWQILNRHEVKR